MIKIICKIIGLILCGILFYIILTVPGIPILLTWLDGMAIGWTSASLIFNWGEQLC